MRSSTFLLALLLLAPPAFAEWFEASSDHFLIYANDREGDVRNFAERLERYRVAMGVIFPARDGVPSPSNRVTIYVLKNRREVAALHGSGSVNGFYIPRAGGNLAFVPPIDASRRSVSSSESVLLHEYAHHFMWESASYVIPRWFSEGFAEYFAKARFEADGAVTLGIAANYRGYNQPNVRRVGIRELVDSTAYTPPERGEYDNFYPRSWLLFHFLYSTQEGRNQMQDYLMRLNRAEGELAAATAAFGDLDALMRKLYAYELLPELNAWRVAPELLQTGAVKIRELRDGEVASIPVRIRSRRGIRDIDEAQEVVTEARKVAERYPEESEVQAALAEAEYDAGNDEAATAAADRALAGNPAHINALMQKGYALARMAAETADTEAWTTARRHFLAVNAIEADHPLPFVYYYLSFLGEGKDPTPNAIEGLKWALELAPYDNTLRLLVGSQLWREGSVREAWQTMLPFVYAAHPEARSDENYATLVACVQELLSDNATESIGQQPVMSAECTAFFEQVAAGLDGNGNATP